MITIGFGRFEDPETPSYIDFSVPRDIADRVEKYIESLLDEQNFWYWVGQNYTCLRAGGLWRDKTTNQIVTYQTLEEDYKRYEKETID